MTPRQTLHKLLDKLPESDLYTVQRFLEFMQTQQVEEEPLTAKEIEIINRGLEGERQGRIVSMEEAERRLLGRTSSNSRTKKTAKA